MAYGREIHPLPRREWSVASLLHTMEQALVKSQRSLQEPIDLGPGGCFNARYKV
jgi:hypothetical protein